MLIIPTPTVKELEAAAFRRGVEAMREAAQAAINRIKCPDDPDEMGMWGEAFHAACRTIAALLPPEDKG